MSKGPRIKPEVRQHVIKRALQERKALDEEKLTLDTLVKRITRELKNDKKTPPAPSTMRRMLTDTLNREPSPEDQRWHMNTFKVYGPSSAGLAAIMKAYRFALCHGASLTIRQAKWISRLSEPVKAIYGLPERELTALTIFRALGYASDEVLSEVMGRPFDSTDRDTELALALSGYDLTEKPEWLNLEYLEQRAADKLHNPDTDVGAMRERISLYKQRGFLSDELHDTARGEQDVSKRLRTKDRSEPPGAVPEMTDHARERVCKSANQTLSPEILKFKEMVRMRGKRKDTEEAK
jgi:hypothetical protein